MDLKNMSSAELIALVERQEAELRARAAAVDLSMLAQYAFERNASVSHYFHVDDVRALLGALAAGQPAAPSAPSAPGPLLSGHYAGIILGKNGEQNYDLILLPDMPSGTMNWDDAMAWAVSVGGALPTRREQALLYANLPEQFEPECYWSGDDSAELSDCAWSQDYDSGNQDGCSDKSSKCRARAVIRVPVTAKGE